MKILIIGGNRFVGLRLALELEKDPSVDLSILNRTGQSPHLKRAAIYKGDRRNLALAGLDKDWDLIVDFANYTDVDTQAALSHFGRVSRYIFISTASVYEFGANRKEDQFVATKWSLGLPTAHTDAGHAYQDGKRRAEALFAQQNRIPVVAVRFPFILGPDDYTRRLEFHVERIEKNQTLYVPNMSARISMIHAEDACRFIHWSLTKDFTGPINVASPQPISMAELIKNIETKTKHRALLVQSASPQNRSPYGPAEDSFLNCDLVTKLGFTARPIHEWIGNLIDGAREEAPPSLLH